MNNVLVYCELTRSNHIADVSLEICTKGRQLASEMHGRLQAVVAGDNVEQAAKELFPYGVDEIFVANDSRLASYRTLPHFIVLSKVLEQQQPDVVLFGATTVGRDLAPPLTFVVASPPTAPLSSLALTTISRPANTTTSSSIRFVPPSAATS